jgi:hypothetical protein
MLRRTVLTISLCGMMSALSLPADARAGVVYVYGNGAFGALDPTTGAITYISGSDGLAGLGFDTKGNLYGLGFSPPDAGLDSVNTTTGSLTPIGDTGLSWYQYPMMGSASDGTLYAADEYGYIYTINANTGAATTVGNLGFGGRNSQIVGDNSGDLYIINNTNDGLYSVNRATGVGTLIGTLNIGTVYGMAFTDGTMYAMQYGSGTGIYALDLTNGNATLVSNYDPSIVGGIYSAAAPLQSVPEPPSFALLATGALVLMGLRVVRLRTRSAGLIKEG